MANATARVAKSMFDYRNDKTKHSYATISSLTQLYNGAMLGINSSGYLQKFDDTQSLRFYGLVLDEPNKSSGGQGPRLPTGTGTSGTQGDGTLDVDVKQPKYFELAISGVTIGDIGRPVYAVDDQTGTLDPTATAYQNRVGVVRDVVYATNPASNVTGIAEVTPSYDVALGGGVAGIYSASGALLVRQGLHVITKTGSLAAMTLAAPTAGTHDGMELEVTCDTAFAHTVTCPASTFKNGGAAVTIFTFTGTTSGGGVRLRAYNATWKVIASAGGSFS